jgi:adenylate cyclase class 2
LDGLRSRLVELEAERVNASCFEENFLFDRGGELENAGSLLRLRVDAHGTRLTFKGPASFDGDVKVRVEHELVVDDADQARALIESLGYECAQSYQKYREEWRLGGVLAALDHTPIGDYAEFEGAGAEKLACRCEFDPETAERRNYVRLYKDYREEHPEAPANMIFP